MAYAEWLLYCDREVYDANVADQMSAGLLTLFDDPEPEMTDIESSLDELAAGYYADYLPDLLRSHGPLRPIENIELVYGSLFGRARVKHLRAAIKALHSQGIVDDNGVGDFWIREISIV